MNSEVIPSCASNRARTPLRGRREARVVIRFGSPEDAARRLRAFSRTGSKGGLCILTRRPYAVGDALRILMTVAGVPYDLRATVAWVRREGIGVRFVDATS